MLSFYIASKRRFLCLCAIAAFAGFLVTAAFAGNERLVDELIERQSMLRTVHASFVQEKYDPMLGRPITSKGDFYFKVGSGVRWEYEDVLVVYDGKVLYVYSPETGEAEKIRGKQGFMGPLAFDLNELSKEYDMEASREGESIKLRLRPKKDMPFESIELVFKGQEAFPSEVSITETIGDTSSIRFDDVKLNAQFSDEMFVFQPSPGTIVKERQLE
jgi:outer membrane lipoprotein carrier protein